MLSTVQIATQPTVEPLSLDLVRQHCRIDYTGDDVLLSGYLRAARTMAESYLGRVLITQTILWTMTPENSLRPMWHFLRGPLVLPRSPVQSISSVTVLDQRGNSTAISPATLPIVPPAQLLGYRSDLAHVPARLYIGPSTILTDGRELRIVDLENIQVQFVAGYGADATTIPQPILDAILLYTGFLYEHRGDAPAEMPKAAEWLMDPYRLMWVA
jgi:uncharacterized phiE125 gp8 family phage protein